MASHDLYGTECVLLRVESGERREEEKAKLVPIVPTYAFVSYANLYAA